MMKKIDAFIDQFTMYRLLILYLVGLIGVSFFLALFRDISYNPLSILVTAIILVSASWIINKIFSEIFNAPAGNESAVITGLILALIISPTLGLYNILFFIAAAGLAMASKYILTINKKHLFNPAAIAVVLTALGPRQSASWWVGTAALLPFVIAGGYLIIRKIHRERMFLYYLSATTLSTILFALISKVSVGTSLHDMVFSSAVFFLGFVMLTEPLTSPARSKQQNIYGVIVGALLPPQVHFLNYYTTPEVALIIGNIYSYLVSPKVKLLPILKRKIRITPDSADFIFDPDSTVNYLPGQYMEWTLPHENTDSRGNRRYFTLASSPTEPDLRIGLKFYNKGSSFKEAMLQIDSNSLIGAHHLAGDFVLPDNIRTKLVLIAGGIGITPYRSMIKYLIDKHQRRDIILIYSARHPEDFAYQDVFDQAKKELGVRVLYVLTGHNQNQDKDKYLNGRISKKLIEQYVPDYDQRIFYLSGTNNMVQSISTQLRELNLPKSQIKTDNFSGYS
jgi:ferredoxin-NADP reductase/Na+-translocating ferredoxin:NAD+ oxidoreductase RnfD subunit